MNLSNWDCFGIFYAYLLKIIIISPRRMNTMICFFFAEIIPFLYFFYYNLFTVIFAEFLIIDMCNTLNNHGILMRKSIICNLLSFTKSFRKIYSRSDSSLSWWLKTILDYKVGILFACSMINDSSLRAISREMVNIGVLTDPAKMTLMVSFASYNLAHQKSIKISIVILY